MLPDFAWATAQWKIALADRQTVVSVRVTEIIAQDATSLRVVAASFSVPPPAGSTGIGEPAPAIVSGAPPAREPDTWLTSPKELADHVRNDDATTLIGSDVKEFALGADESRKMLAGWKNVKLEFVGNVHAIEGAGYRIVVAYARWRGPKPTLFRVFALFVPGEAIVGPAPWELATAQYSVAVPASEPQIATAVATAPESRYTIAALACDRFSTNGQTGKKLHALVFAAEQAGRDPACTLGPELLGRAMTARPDRRIGVVLAVREYEAWFLAAAESLRGRRGLPADLAAPPTPEVIRDAKGWLGDRMPRGYSPTADQPALTDLFDLELARRTPSFDKLVRELTQLLLTIEK